MDMYPVIERIVDKDSFFEFKKLYAKEMITGFCRIGGRSIGIVANQSKVKGGVIFPESAEKAAHFISLCDAYNIPLLFLVDLPGFMVGSKVEKEAIIRRGARMLSTVANATVPRIAVIVRKGLWCWLCRHVRCFHAAGCMYRSAASTACYYGS